MQCTIGNENTIPPQKPKMVYPISRDLDIEKRSLRCFKDVARNPYKLSVEEIVEVGV